MDRRPIGVFDSGLGGLTAVKKLRERMPNEHIIYFGDTGRVPYGSKGVETIRRYAAQDIAFLLGFDVKLILAACGTVSSCVTDEMASGLPVPFLRVIDPAADAAVRLSPSGKIGVLGTAATVRSGSYLRAIRARKPEAEVYSAACPMFVPLVENGHAAHPATRMFAEEYLGELLPHGVDTIVLGCTHYPLLIPVLSGLCGCTLIDTGEQAALATEKVLKENDLCSDSVKGRTDFWVSDLTDTFCTEAARFLGTPVDGQVSRTDIEKTEPIIWKK